ncbi:hypothetical protein [Borreliella americana]|nr:hypothetical protein [Borreliella americana]
MIADCPTSDATSRYNQENKDKLTEENKNKLMGFLAYLQHINLV